MVALLTFGITVACALLAVYLLVLIIRNRPIDNVTLWAGMVIEVAALVLVVRGLIGVFAGGLTEPVTTALYLILVPLVLPGAVLLSAGEKTRSSTALVMAAQVVMMILMLRVDALWVGL